MAVTPAPAAAVGPVPRQAAAGRPGHAVAVATDGATPVHLLDAALQALGFAESCRAPADAGRALVLVDLGAFERDSPVLPDRALVEALIDRLAALGWNDIALGSSADSSSTWAQNRSVPVLADLFGYCYETPAGTPYDIADLSEHLVDGGFPPGSVLAGSPLSRDWKDAGLRIVVAKGVTDLRDTVVLGAGTLLAALPVHDKDLAYRLAMDVGEAASLLLAVAPPRLTVIDLCGIAHGTSARMAPQRADTRAVVASADLLAADAAAAAKLGADPAASPLWAGLAARHGLRPPRLVLGDLAPLPGVRLPDAALAEATRRRDRSALFARLLPPWLQRIDTTLFPFQHPLDARIHQRLAHRLADPDGDALAHGALSLLNRWCVAADFALGAWQVSHDKDRIARRHAGVSPRTLACTQADCQAMEAELDALAAWLSDGDGDGGPAPHALRWRKLGGAVLFRLSHDYPVPFEDFVVRVDVSRTIQLMNDYIGGSILVIERDAQGRPRRQVERNLYLVQPNYLAWWGGQEIDVAKIETVHHDTGCHRMYWKTVESENGSAEFDDGVVRIEAVGAATTRVSVLGRQLFARPPLIEALRLDLHPQLEGHLIEQAYTTFFSRTFSNFEALLEGREIAIGTPLPALDAPGRTQPRPIDALADAAAQWAELLAPLLQGLLQRPSGGAPLGGPPAAGVRDAEGFLHFSPAAVPTQADAPPPWWQDSARGLVEALLRDWARVSAPAGAPGP